MTTITPTAGGPVRAEAPVQLAAQARLLFVDNLRVFLTVLVIMHHLLITYAGSGSWYYQEGRQDFTTLAIGSWVLSVNQAFFMGLFLFIAAYFVPASDDHKGAPRFLKDRFIRLGIPLAVYSWVVAPVFAYLLLGATGQLQPPFWRFFPGRYFAIYGPLIGAGPLWFIETLLLFSTAYALWRVARPGAISGLHSAHFPRNGAVALFALGLGLVTFLVRLVFPVDWSFRPLNLQFPHFAQYIALFVAGLIAYRQDWLRALPDKTGRLWLAIAGFLILLFVPMALLLDAAENSALFKGGWYWHALIYALWESVLCVALCIGITYLFRRHANRQGTLARFLGRNAYGAFIIHAPIITFMGLALRDVTLYPLLKFLLLTLVSVPLCFGLSSLLLRLPYAERVL
jgi:surface polysaccharide O-acyltransferase-like enzyme